MDDSFKQRIEMPSLVEELIQSCATQCHPGCCGWSAFDLDPEQVCKWVQNAGEIKALRAREELDRFRVRVRTEKLGISSVSMDWHWNFQEADDWLATFSGFLADAGFSGADGPLKVYPHLDMDSH